MLRLLPLLLAFGLVGAAVSASSEEPLSREQFLERARNIDQRGSAFSQYMIGVYYLQGKEIEQDTAEAVRWFRKGALMGDHASQMCMAHAYQYGEGVAKDPVEALAWRIVSSGTSGKHDDEVIRDLERILTLPQAQQAKKRSAELLALVAEGERMAQARFEQIQREIAEHELRRVRPASDR